jgi:hypothetical protein
MKMATKIPGAGTPTESVVLSWRYPDGTVASGHPLPRDQAEQLARVYGGMHPDQTFWLEPSKLGETSGYGRVRRRRAQASPLKT